MKRRGFTLVEVLVAVALVAIIVGIAVPAAYRMQRQGRLRDETRAVVSQLRKARALAANGATMPVWGPGEHTRSAGLRVIDEQRYAIFVDRDATTDGDEADLLTVELAASEPGSLVIESPAVGTEIRFRGNGTVVAPSDIIIFDRGTNQRRTVVVTGGGQTRVR